MFDIVRQRQLLEAEVLDVLGEEYDWDNDLRTRGMLKNAAYHPEIDDSWRKGSYDPDVD